MGRNLADALGKLGADPLLLSVLGEDLPGRHVMEKTLPHLVSFSENIEVYRKRMF